MEIHSEIYKLEDICDVSFKTVPRGFFTSETSQIALDYHSLLLNLQKGDSVQLKFYSKKPEILKNIYLMAGSVYKIEENTFECSFGGLLLLYKGHFNGNISEDDEIFVSISKI